MRTNERGWAVVSVVMVLYLAFAGWAALDRQARRQNVTRAITGFYQSLASHDWGGLAGVAAPRLGERLAQSAQQMGALHAALRDLGVQRLEVAGRAARADVVVEVELSDGTRDLHLHTVELVRLGDGWRVARVEQSLPLPAGDKAPPDFEAAALEQYIRAVGRGDWAAAEAELVGAARAAHRAGVTALGPAGAGLYSEVTAPQIEVLAGDSRLVLAQASYRIDGRRVVVRVLFGRVGEGWRVAAIQGN